MIDSAKRNTAPIAETGAAVMGRGRKYENICIISFTEKRCQISVIAEHICLLTIAARQQMSVGDAAGM